MSIGKHMGLHVMYTHVHVHGDHWVAMSMTVFFSCTCCFMCMYSNKSNFLRITTFLLGGILCVHACSGKILNLSIKNLSSATHTLGVD